jgi:heme exporter protein D
VYLSRSERGARLNSVRLVGPRTDASWVPPVPAESASKASGVGAAGDSSDGTDAAPGWSTRDYDSAAAWIQSRLSTLGIASPSLLCLDADGAACAWLTSPSADSEVLSALALAGGVSASGSESKPSAALSFFAGDGSAASFQALGLPAAPAQASPKKKKSAKGAIEAEEPAAAGQRLAVIGALDVPARLLLDALDQRGLSVATTQSIWHAMASAWDPAGPASPGRDAAPAGENNPDVIVAEPRAQVCAIVLIEPQGRLLWAWSRDGVLLAAGSARTPTTPEGPAPDASSVSRVTADWISWSLQLGAAPERIVIVAPAIEASTAVPAFGAGLASAWNGAVVDLVQLPDPLGATLGRLSGIFDVPAAAAPLTASQAPGRVMSSLSRRPGRAHQMLFVWAAVVITVLAVVLLVVTVQHRSAANEARRAKTDLEARIRTTVEAAFKPALLDAAGPVIGLERELDQLERKLRPPTPTETSMPILQELEALSFVLGDSRYTLRNLTVGSIDGVRLVISGELSALEELVPSLNNLSGSVIPSWSFSPRDETRDGVRTTLGTYSGRWPANLTPGPAKAGEAKAPDAKAPEAKAPAAKAPEAKPPASAPAEPAPPEPKPAESKPAESKPTESKPAEAAPATPAPASPEKAEESGQPGTMPSEKPAEKPESGSSVKKELAR